MYISIRKDTKRTGTIYATGKTKPATSFHNRPSSYPKEIAGDGGTDAALEHAGEARQTKNQTGFFAASEDWR